MLLEAKDVHKIYNSAENTVHVLKGIDLEIAEGEILTIVGPSGAGKSTLLHIVGGLDMPDKGQVLFEGKEIYKLNDQARAKVRNEKIGFVFQFYHLLPEFSALENVILPLLIKHDSRNTKKFEKEGLIVLDQVGLSDRAKHKPKQLSGGEQQRVAIARALINQPKIVFCDEPTGNLDSDNSKGILDLLIDLNNKNTQTVVIVTHDEDIAKISNRTIYLKDGKIINQTKRG